MEFRFVDVCCCKSFVSFVEIFLRLGRVCCVLFHFLVCAQASACNYKLTKLKVFCVLSACALGDIQCVHSGNALEM